MNFKKIVCSVLAVATTMACAGTLTACETDTPEVELTLSFNKKTYTLSYELNRKITPKTVNHFLALVDNHYYDDMCIHDYTEAKWYTGAYKMDTPGELEYVNYFTDKVKSYIPKSVWRDDKKTMPTYTLYGEFSANKFEVSSGFKKESFGSLVMYYTAKDVDLSVSIEKNDGKGMAIRNYTENSATSQFYISMSSTATTNSKYCVFATLDSGSVSTLKSLQSAIADYIDEHYNEEGGETFTKQVEMTIDQNDETLGDYENEDTFDVPNEPIKIETIKVTKY